MATALQCPECGHRHRLDGLSGRSFRCESCGRLLKVPESLQGAGSPAGARAGRARDPDATQVVATAGGGHSGGTGATTAVKVPPSQRPAGGSSARAGTRVPRTLRALVWAFALPLGLVPVLLLGRITGFLSINRVLDVYLGGGATRFLPPLVILPFWAAGTATFAHVGIEGIGRVRRRRAGPS